MMCIKIVSSPFNWFPVFYKNTICEVLSYRVREPVKHSFCSGDGLGEDARSPYAQSSYPIRSADLEIVGKYRTDLHLLQAYGFRSPLKHFFFYFIITCL